MTEEITIHREYSTRAPGALKPWPNNARNHDKNQLEQLCALIKKFGFTSPVLIDEHDNILAGHGRTEAASLVRLDEIPVLVLRGLSDDEKRAYVLNNTKGHDVILDSFGGSGTTMIAAEKHGRTARLIELDPKYCDVIVRRWQAYTGQHAIRESDGLHFDDLAHA